MSEQGATTASARMKRSRRLPFSESRDAVREDKSWGPPGIVWKDVSFTGEQCSVVGEQRLETATGVFQEALKPLPATCLQVVSSTFVNISSACFIW